MAGSRDHQRPLHSRQMSYFILPHTKHAPGKHDAVSPALPDERSPLLPAPPPPPAINMEDLTSPTSTDPNHNRSLSISTAHASLQRPNIARAATTTAAVSPGTIITRARREPARPELPRAITSTASLIGRPHLSKDTTDRMDHPRASFLSRATQAISNQLELGPNDHRNAPPAPSNWSDALHRKYLVRLWDMVEEKAAKSKSQVSTTTRVVGTEKSMLHNFPELGKGDVVLNRDWVEYVLGVALRHPFCTTERMGRWEILASSGGARGTWGPW